MDPILSAFLSSPLLGGLGAFAMAGAMAMLFYYLSATGRLFTRTQHEGEINALKASHAESLAVIKAAHETTLEHFTQRNEKLEQLFEAQEETIKSQQLVNASKHAVIAQQSGQIEQLMEVGKTLQDFLDRAPRIEVPE